MKLLLVAALLLPPVLFACLNDGSVGVGPFYMGRGPALVNRLRTAMATKPDDQASVGRFKGNSEDISSPQFEEFEAIREVLSGNLNAAIARLKKLEGKTPGEYSTAANLGTAYELAGDNVNALKWIKEGIVRNAESHFGTEWLHVLVLEAKVEAAKHPDHPLKGRLLDLPEKMKEGTSIQVDGKILTVKQIEQALFFQLQERMVFVKPKDVYVADLLYSFALIEANLDFPATGLQLLKMAREYGFADEALFSRREKEFQWGVMIAEILGGVKLALWIVSPFLLLWYCYRKKWFFLSGRAYRAHREAMALARR